MTDRNNSIPVPHPERQDPPRDPERDPQPPPEQPWQDPSNPGRKINLPPDAPVPSRPIPRPEQPMIT